VSAVDDYLTYCKAAGLSAGTLKIKRHYLDQLAAHVDLLNATEADLVAWLSRDDWKPETRRSARSMARTFYKWAARQGLVDTDPSAYLPTVRVPQALPKPAGDDAFAQAMNDPDPKVRSMLLLATYAGLRRAEIANLRKDDITASHIYVHGKGGKVRKVPIHPELADALAAQMQATEGPWLYPGRFNGPVHVDHVYRVIKRSTGGASPHKFRHRFATNVYRGSHDLRSVQQLLGHSSPTTTARYVAVDDDAMTRAVMSATQQNPPTQPLVAGGGGAYSSKYQPRSSVGISSGSRSIVAENPRGWRCSGSSVSDPARAIAAAAPTA
jgi:integrase/recombinase XerC